MRWRSNSFREMKIRFGFWDRRDFTWRWLAALPDVQAAPCRTD